VGSARVVLAVLFAGRIEVATGGFERRLARARLVNVEAELPRGESREGRPDLDALVPLLQDRLPHGLARRVSELGAGLLGLRGGREWHGRQQHADER
jgi:hypothetical protein